jgi:hypothetical protein
MGKKILGLKGIIQLQYPNQTFSPSIIKVTSLQLKALDKRLTHPQTIIQRAQRINSND